MHSVRWQGRNLSLEILQRVQSVQADESSSGYGTFSANGSGVYRPTYCGDPARSDRGEGYLDAKPSISPVSYAGECAYDDVHERSALSECVHCERHARTGQCSCSSQRSM